MANLRKQVWIISTQFGGKRLVTRQQSAALKMAKLFIGSRAALAAAAEYAKNGKVRLVEAVKPALIRKAIAEAKEDMIVVLTAEDPTSSGAGEVLTRALAEYKPFVFPGVPVSVYAASRMGVGLENAYYADLRTREVHLRALCRLYPKVMVRASKNMKAELKALMDNGLRQMDTYVLAHPAEEDERLFHGKVFEIAVRELPDDAIYLFLRPHGTAGTAAGIKAADFEGNAQLAIPDEVRALVMARMQITPSDIVYVIGAGIGDAAVEAAEHAAQGKVFAIEQNPALLELLRKNCARFASRNVQIIPGEAPAALGHLPPADSILIRGCPESVVDLIQIAMSRNPDVRITVLTRTMEKAVAALRQMESKSLDAQLIQLMTGCGKSGNGGVTIEPGSTAFVISGRRK